MDFCHLIVTCLFSMRRLPFDNQKVKGNYAIFFKKSLRVFIINKIKINHYILKALLNAYFRKKSNYVFHRYGH